MKNVSLYAQFAFDMKVLPKMKIKHNVFIIYRIQNVKIQPSSYPNQIYYFSYDECGTCSEFIKCSSWGKLHSYDMTGHIYNARKKNKKKLLTSPEVDGFTVYTECNYLRQLHKPVQSFNKGKTISQNRRP